MPKRTYTGAIQANKRYKAVATRFARSLVRAPANRTLLQNQQRMQYNSKEQKDLTVRTTGIITLSQSTSNAGVLLNGVAQGTTGSTRIGRRIDLKSLNMRLSISLTFNNQNTQPSQTSPIRFLIVYDKQTNAAAPATTAVVLTDEINSPNNLVNSRRFVTLIDEVIPCICDQGPSSITCHRYVKLRDLPMEFGNGSAGTVADITTGSIYFFAWQDGQLTTQTGVSLTSSLYTRIRFVDA